MVPKIAMLYSSVDGHTLKICKQLKEQFTQANIITELHPIDGFKEEISNYKIILIGASIRYGKHDESVTHFFNQHKNQLKSVTTAFFSVNLVARKKEKSTADTNPYLLKFLKKLDNRPDHVDVFAGKLYYPSYPFWDRLIIKLIMKMTNGPLKTEKPLEYTDWDKVQSFGHSIIRYFKNN